MGNETICLNSKVDGKQPSLTDRVYHANGVMVAVTTTPFFMGNIQEGNESMGNLRIRKLTEAECLRFMGFERKDYEACVSVGQSAANIYHEAGDSIVTTVLVGIFGELLGADYKNIIESYADKLHAEVNE